MIIQGINTLIENWELRLFFVQSLLYMLQEFFSGNSQILLDDLIEKSRTNFFTSMMGDGCTSPIGVLVDHVASRRVAIKKS